MSCYGILLILFCRLLLGDGAKETGKNDAMALIKKILNDITLLTEHVQSQEIRLTKRIQGLETDITEKIRLHELKISEQIQTQDVITSEQIKHLGTNIKTLETKMTEGMQGVKTEITGRIQGLEAKMTEGLQGLRTEVTGQVHTLRSDVTGQIGEIKTEITGQIGEIKTEITGQIEGLETKVSGQVVNMTEQLHLQKERQTKQVKELDTKITRQVERERLKLEDQDARLRKVESHINGSGIGEVSQELKKFSLKVDGVNKILTGVPPGKTRNTPAPSCNWLRDHYFNLRKERYWILSKNRQPIYVYCDMAPETVSFTECRGPKITASQAVIKYPVSGHYDNYESCQWNIQTGESVTISFNRFDLADGSPYDYVSIYVDGNKIGQWGGTSIPPPQRLNGDIKINFLTDESNVATGFEAYIFSNSECLQNNHNDMDLNMTLGRNSTSSRTYCTFTKCHGPKITTLQTSIKYPATGNYGDNEHCEWDIQTGGEVTLTFSQFDLADSDEDIVAIYADGKEIGRWGGATVMPSPQTLSGDIKIIFHSGVSVVATGFQVYINDNL